MRASRESFGGGWNEAMIFRDGEFVISRFALKAAAIGWANEQRGDIEKGIGNGYEHDDSQQ
jgi:hypothetical protein